jgi:hypothetical protein
MADGSSLAAATLPQAEGKPARKRALVRLARLGFVGIYLAGALYGSFVLFFAWQLRLLLQLLGERSIILRLLHLPWTAFLVALALAVVLIWTDLARLLRRWKRHQPEPDIGVRARALAYTAAACLLWNVFFLSVPEAFSGPFRVRFAIISQMSAILALGAYSLWWRLLPAIRRRCSARTRRALDVVGANVVLLFALTELTLRLVATFWPSPLLVTKASPSQIRRDSDRQPPGTLRFGFPMNSGGFYDSEFVPRAATERRVVTDIGDSFSYGVVPHAYHFTTLAEKQLGNVDIYNIGYPGLSPSDYLYLLQQDALPLDPDLVLVNLFVGNDIVSTASPAGPARWYDADSYLTAVVWYRLKIMRKARLIDVSASGNLDSAQHDITRAYPWLIDPSRELPSLSADVFGQLETRNALGIAVPIDGVYETFFRTLGSITQAAANVRLGFVIIPDEFQVEEDLWNLVSQRAGRPLDRDLAQRTIVSWLKGRGLPVLDLLPVMRAVPPMKDGRRHLYQLRDTHFNARGNEVAARALAPFVDSLLSLPVAPHTLEAPPLPLAPSALPFRLVLGDTAARRWMWTGWDQDESGGGRTYVWSAGTESALRVLFPVPGDVRMDFEVNPFVYPGSAQQKIAVMINGQMVEEVPLQAGMHRYSVTLPGNVLRPSPNTLGFRYAYARVPQEVLRGSPDARTLAVAWYSIDFSRPDPTLKMANSSAKISQLPRKGS